MTPEEAIQHCKEVAEDYEELNGKKSAGKNSGLKFQVYPVQPKPYKIEIDPITQVLIDYNNDLRRMLRLAIEELEPFGQCAAGAYRGCNECPYCADDATGCKWRHHDEAMKLLGGAKNAEN
jgi:hypothetical protein